MPSILFVCTGNICRSPQAMTLFRRLVRPSQAQQDWRIESAGTWAAQGIPASAHAQTVIEEMGEDLSKHRSRRVTRELLESFNLILTMEAGHKEALQAEFPDLANRIYMLSEMSGTRQNVVDPLGKSLSDYQDTAHEIDQLLQRGFARILQLAGEQPGD